MESLRGIDSPRRRGEKQNQNAKNYPLKKIIITAVKIGIPVLLIGYLVWDAVSRGESVFTDDEGNFVPQRVYDVVNHAIAHWWWLAAALAAATGGVVLTLIRWYWLVRALDIPLPFKDALRIGFLGYLTNFTPLGIAGGDLLKAWLLAREHKDRRAEALVSVVVDRALGLYMLFVVASVAILLSGFWDRPEEFPRWVSKITLILTGVGTFIAILVVTPDYSRGRTTQWLERVPRVGVRLLKLVRSVQMYQKRLPALAAAALVSVGVHSLFTLEVYFIVTGLYEVVPELGIHFVLSPVSNAMGLVPLSCGPFEWMLNELYTYAQLPGGGSMAPGQGLVVAFVHRIITVAVAMLAIGYYFKSREEVTEVLHEVEHDAELVNPEGEEGRETPMDGRQETTDEHSAAEPQPKQGSGFRVQDGDV